MPLSTDRAIIELDIKEREFSLRRNLFNLMVCSTNIMKEKMLVTMSQYINIAPIRRSDLVLG